MGVVLQRRTGKLSAVMGQAKYLDGPDGVGSIVEIPACAVTADELKKELQGLLKPSQYTIQVSLGFRLLKCRKFMSNSIVI